MTAVEFIVEQVLAYKSPTNVNGTDYILIPVDKIDFLKEQSKEMEKEQHNETWDSAHQAGRFEGKGIAEENWQTFESHWEETFKSE